MSTTIDLKSAVNRSIGSFEFSRKLPENLYAPIQYILALGGKRIRPILTMLAYHAVSENEPEDVMNLALSLELFHNFTLMHDDIMDRAPFRRGKPSTHMVWDEDIAMLSGDALFAFSVGLVVKDYPEKSDKLVEEFSRVAIMVCEGQMEDMDLAQASNVSLTEYLEMIRKKTAVLLGGCMRIGAIAGGASEEVVKKFEVFGESVGLAFQLQDDLMDVFPPEKFGKQIGGDIIENKKTFLLIKALELANSEQKDRLTTLYAKKGEDSKKVEDVIQIFKELDIEVHTKKAVQHYYEKAVKLSRELSDITHFEVISAYLQEIANRTF